MSKEADLIPAGFFINEEGDYQFNGKHWRFKATIWDAGTSMEYVSLHFISDKIDNRPLSPRFGKPLFDRIKDCCSPGSVERALMAFDRPKIK